jgi:hypothetical protein
MTGLVGRRISTCGSEGQQIWYRLNTTVAQDAIAWDMDLVERGAKKRGNSNNLQPVYRSGCDHARDHATMIAISGFEKILFLPSSPNDI